MNYRLVTIFTFFICLVGIEYSAIPELQAAGESLKFESREGAIIQHVGNEIIVQDGSAVIKGSPSVPRVLEFEAQMPSPQSGLPSFGIGQIWFSCDYKNEFDRVAFSIRGERLQEVLMYDFQQREPPSPELFKKSGKLAHGAFKRDFLLLQKPVEPKSWVKVRVTEKSDSVTVKINDEPAKTWMRECSAECDFALGGSWQRNRFRNVSVRTLSALDAELLGVPDGARKVFLPNSLKYNCGGNSLLDGWINVGISEEAEWVGPTAGSRNRPMKGAPIFWTTCTALAHGKDKAVLSLKVPEGEYLVNVGYGDASYHISGSVRFANDKKFMIQSSAGQWKELRHSVAHKGGAMDLAFDKEEGGGLSISYVVLEPLVAAKRLGLLKKESIHEDNESRRKLQRSQYEPLHIQPRGTTIETFDLSGSWLVRPAYECVGGEELPENSDEAWHVAQVPSFWNINAWWLFNLGPRSASQRFFNEEIRRCNKQTYNWKKTNTLWYRHWLNIPEGWNNRRVFLQFDAAATVCSVYFNGVNVGKHVGMFSPFEIEVTDELKPGKENLIALLVNNGNKENSRFDDSSAAAAAVTMPITKDLVSGFARGIYSTSHGQGGERITHRQGGIWQGVRLYTSEKVRIKNVHPITETDSLSIRVEADNADNSIMQITVSKDGEKLITDSRKFSTEKLLFDKLTPELWSPQTPNLYDLELKLFEKGKLLDMWKKKIGFRTFKVDGEYFRLNGRRYHWLGANMPPHGLKPNDRAAAAEFFAWMRKGNQFATRAVCSPLPKVWLEEADKAGILVSQEGTWSWLNIHDTKIPASISYWQKEWLQLVKEQRHHPSIVMWTVNNETYLLRDKDKKRRLEKWRWLQDTITTMRQLDPTRPIVPWSGYTRKTEQKGIDSVRGNFANFDDGDIDDKHGYGGTYTGSWASRLPYYSKEFSEKYKTPGRPLISQEAGKPYPNTDTGHQEFSYQKMWHPQIWVGNNAYDHRNPTETQKRLARLTKDHLAYVRRLPVAGWLAFCNGTWMHDALFAGDMLPFPVWQSASESLGPVLVAMDMPERRFFTGTKRPIEIFVANDHLEGKDIIGCNLKIRTVNRKGQTISSKTYKFPDVPYFENRTMSFAYTFPAKIEGAKESMKLHLCLTDNSGLQAINEYDIDVYSNDFVKSLRKHNIKLNISAANSVFGKLMEKAGFETANSKDAAFQIYRQPDESEWKMLIKNAAQGATVLVISPTSISPVIDQLGDAFLSNPSHGGEFAEVVEKVSPLNNGLSCSDYMWWAHPEKRVNTYNQSIYYKSLIPKNVTPIVKHIPLHTYGLKWRVQYLVLEVNTGKGKIILSTLNFDGVDLDPAAARFAVNLVDSLFNLAGSINNKY